MYVRSCKKAFVVALSVAILYTLCTLLHVLLPEQAALWSAQLHMMKPMAFSSMISIDWMSYLSGVVQVFIMTYILIMLICVFKCLFGCCKSPHGACCSTGNHPGNPGDNNCRRM